MAASKLSSPLGRLITPLVLLAIVGGMLGLSFAAVPLYDLFCRVTGYGGTTQVATTSPDSEQITGTEFRVFFDANVDRSLPWRFSPPEAPVSLRLGENALVYYEALNLGDSITRGTASFNVAPPTLGAFFVKIECFCFQEQELAPGESVRMPVSFYIDPAVEEEPLPYDHLTLSYTFHALD